MGSEQTHRLGDLQLSIMQALWKNGASGVADVQQAIGGHLAYTTIATMLRKMEDRHLVRHRQEGRRFIYEAEVSQRDVTRSMADRLVDRLFAGSLSRTVSHLLETREIDRQELVRLEQLIQQRKSRDKGQES
jgi:predicted transcriptional regulator